MPLRWHGARRWPGCKDKEGQPPLEAPPLLELPLLGYRNEACFRLHLGSNHRTSPNGAYLSLRAPATRGLPTPSGGQPGIGDQPTHPWASGQKALALPMQSSSAPQGTLPAHQPGPSQPATPSQQAAQPQSQPAAPHEQPAQPPRRSTGRGLLARPTSDGPTPPADSIYQDRGRQQTRGRGLPGQLTSHPRQG